MTKLCSTKRACLFRPRLHDFDRGHRPWRSLKGRSTHVERATDVVEEFDEEGILAFAERVL
jgi:hypothetical protein